MADPNAAVLSADHRRATELLALPQPDEQALVDAARLLLRYTADGFGAGVQATLLQALQRWGLSREELHARTRALWSSGWRPPLDPRLQLDGVAVGSGADVGAT